MELKPIHQELIRFGVTVAVAAGIGGYIGYKSAYEKALTIPAPAQYAVVDMVKLAGLMYKNIDPSKPSGQAAIGEITQQLQAQLDEYTKSGMVILEAHNVIAAPPEAFIDAEELYKSMQKQAKE